jgi:hypothetical protein
VRSLFTLLLLCGALQAVAEDLAPYRTAQPDPRVARVPSEVATGIFSDPERFIKPLVQNLTSGLENDFQKVKVFHDWVAVNIAYDQESYTKRIAIDQGWTTTLTRRTAVCGGYAMLMVKLCEMVGIECVQVAGNGRGDPLQPDEATSDHAWNAVKIGSTWYLMDVTWDSGHAMGKGAVSAYRSEWLFLEPEAFIYTHFPQESRWQLLSPAKSAAEWGALPFLSGKFFNFGMRLTTPLAKVTRTGSAVQFTVSVAPDVLMMTKLMAGSDEQPQRTLASREEGGYRVLATFPSAGTYSLFFCCKRRSDPGSWELVGHVGFEAKEGTPDVFPQFYPDFVELDMRLDWPLFAQLPASGSQEFQVRLPRRADIFVEVENHGEQKMEPLAADPTLYRATLKLTSPADKVLMLTRKPGTTAGKVLLSYEGQRR